MAAQIDSIIDTVRRYIAELEKHHIPVSQAILYGSYANGRVRGSHPVMNREDYELKWSIIPLNGFTGDFLGYIWADSAGVQDFT